MSTGSNTAEGATSRDASPDDSTHPIDTVEQGDSAEDGVESSNTAERDLQPEARSRPIWRRAGSVAMVTAVATIFVGATLGGIFILHSRADNASTVQPNPAIQVNTAAVVLEPAYTIEQAFVGRLEPTRQTELAFERSGKVLNIFVDEGDDVGAGQLIAKLGTARLETQRRELEAQSQEIAAQLGLARATEKRQRTLARKGFAATQQFDEARFRVAQLQAGLARIDANLAAIKVDIEKTQLKAPFAGRVASRAMDEGTIASPGRVVVRLLETDRARIRVGISRAASERLRPNRTYQFRAGNRLIDAKLASLRPDLDPSSRTITALFDVAGAGEIPFGAVVTLVLDRTVNQPGAWVPVASLTEGDKGLWTLLTVSQRDGVDIVQREAIEILHIADGRAFVRSSMPEGTRYIRDGTNRVTPGQQVALLDEAQNRSDQNRSNRN